MTNTTTILAAQQNNLTLAGKARNQKGKIADAELVRLFWDAPAQALFNDATIAPVTGRSIKTLQCDRWRKSGIPFRKVCGRVLYSKADVISWLESYPLVKSTSEYKQGG